MRVIHVFLAALLSFILAASPLIANGDWDTLDYYLYGVRHSLDGGTVHTLGGNLAIPEEWRVIDINLSADRLYVCAAFWSADEDLRRSQLWMFPVRPNGGDIAFESRLVLASYKLRGGEATNLCRSTVSCHSGVALYVQQWEHGATRVFDAAGTEVAVEWPKSKSIGGSCCVDYIRPVAWVPGKSGTFELTCILYEAGDLDPYMLFWTFDAGVVERGPMNEILAKRGAELFNGFNRYW